MWQSIERLGLEDCDYYFCPNNVDSLSKKYNEILDQAYENGSEYVVLVHDDVEFSWDIFDETINQLQDCDLLGVAGAKSVKIESPALWHLMGGGFQSGSLAGAVAHPAGEGKVAVTSFGPYPTQVVMIDGVFMAMNRKIIENMRFDETNPAKFHFYDLSFSLDCHKQGYKVQVGAVPLVHMSPGLREFTDEWKEGEKWFLDKHQ